MLRLQICVRQQLALKDRLYHKWKNKPYDMVLRLEYTRCRNITFKLINKAQNNFKKCLIKECKNDYRKVWEYINKWLGSDKKSVDEVILKYMGEECDVPMICKKFNKTYANDIKALKIVMFVKQIY